MIYVYAFLVGVLGARADVVLSFWSDKLSLSTWLSSAAWILVFAFCFGLVMRHGKGSGYPLSVIVMLVLLVNVAAFSLWESYKVGGLNSLHVIGIALALIAAACFEVAAE